uniref:Uncharacterized protein n=1 Tax=Avena sativa TaxID=4498 RepID=A0ACD6AU02_AVESA
MGKVGMCFHLDLDMTITVSKCTWSHGFPHSYQFTGTIQRKLMKIEAKCRSPAECKLDDSRAKMLLHATARLSPQILVFKLPGCHDVKLGRPVEIALPRFHHTVSIELDTHLLRIKPPRVGEFPVLETMSISGNIADLGALLDRCPRLRLLKVTFRGVDLASLEAGLAALEAAVANGLVVSLLGINGNVGRHNIESSRFVPILDAAVRVYSQEFIFTNKFLEYVHVDLPCFDHTMSIEMNLHPVYFRQLQDGVFLVLERLTISESCGVVDLASLVTRCPCLRVLKVTADTCNNVKIHSTSLQEIDLDLFGDNEFKKLKGPCWWPPSLPAYDTEAGEGKLTPRTIGDMTTNANMAA